MFFKSYKITLREKCIHLIHKHANIMKKILSILFLSLIIISCSSDDDVPKTDQNGGKEETPNPYKTETDLSSSTFSKWENKGIEDDFFMLGYGYDATGKYAHPSSIRNRILKMEEFNENEGCEIYFMRSTSSGPELQIGGTQKNCITDMGERAGFDTSEINRYKNLFKETFTSPFKNDTSFPDLPYKYIGLSQVHVKYHLYFMYMSHMQKLIGNYFTDEFKSDLENKSAEEIIRTYGTHLLTAIKIGEKMDYLYRYTEDKNQNSYSWFLHNIPRYFSHGPTTWGSEPESAAPLKENLYIEVVDGTRPNPNTWMIDITNFKGERIIFDGWNNISDANLTLVNFRGNNSLVPIYDLISDPVKKEELIKAYEKYLSE